MSTRDHVTVDARERLAEAVERMVDSQTFAAWLRARAAFHDYSFGNVCLIVSQRPEATRVAGYRTWQQLGRHVRKGERSIKILAPCRVKASQTSPADSDTPAYRVVGFRCVSVFDIAQTDGEPLPELDYRSLDGDAPEAMVELLDKVAANAGLRVEYRTPEIAGAHGYLRRSDSLIVIDPDQSPAMRAKVLAHELGHFFDPSLVEHPDQYGAHRGDAEAVAESVAFVVAARFGLDAGPSAIGYVAAWIDGNADRVRELAERIDKSAATIIGRQGGEA
jgi:antirestriction protein ArdC